jgi:preprotein translocase subunit SecE
MIDFFYDSLETLKTVKRPSNEELGHFILAVIAILIIASIMFIAFDAISGSLYQTLYNITTAN